MVAASSSTVVGGWPITDSNEAKSEVGGFGRTVVVFLFGMVLLFGALAIVVAAFGPDTYSGVDGKFNQDLITTYLALGRPFVVNTLNPLEGVFSQLYPLNIWLNPGFATFLIFDHDIALVTSTAVFLFIFCLSVYAFARAAGVTRGAAIAGAQIAAFVFPPLYHLSGLFSNYDLMPGGSLTVALFMFLLCVLLRLRVASWRNFAIATILATALIGYIVFNDPLTMGVMGFSLLVPFAVTILEARRPAIIALRIAVLAVPAVVFYAAGLVNYVLAMDHYTARYFLSQEFFRPQVPDFVSVLFDFPNAGPTYAFLILGWIAGLLFCRGRARLVPVMATLNFLWIVAYGSAYLFSTVHWFAPLPVYLEEYTVQIAGLGAVVGWAALLQRVFRAGWTASRRWREDPRWKPAAALAAAMIVPAAIAVYGLRIPAGLYGTQHDPWVNEPELTDYLRDNIGLHAGTPFRGTVYVNMIGYRDQMTYVNLWHNLIPTFNEYSQTLTPAYQFLQTRLLVVSKADTEHMKGLFSSARQFVVDQLDVAGLEAVGTRYLLTTDAPGQGIAAGDPPPVLRGQFPGKIPGNAPLDRTWYVYELPNPNVGQFNPTVVHVETTAPAALKAMQDPQFQFERDVLLTKPLDQTLTAAHDVHMTVQRGAVEIQAAAAGPALLVLPIQYSHCLAISGAPGAQLVRADFLLTGILFDKPIDATISLDYGFLDPSCRQADSRDMETMQVRSNQTTAVAERDQNPFAMTSLRMIPTRLRELAGRLKFL